MLILYLGFTFALMFILGDVNSEFDTPVNSGLTLFAAILGDFEFDSFLEEDGANVYLVYFGYAVMLLYLIIGSLGVIEFIGGSHGHHI